MSNGGSLSDAEFDVIDALNGNDINENMELDVEINNLIPVFFKCFSKYNGLCFYTMSFLKSFLFLRIFLFRMIQILPETRQQKV